MDPMSYQSPAFIRGQLLIETFMIVKAYCVKLLKKA